MFAYRIINECRGQAIYNRERRSVSLESEFVSHVFRRQLQLLVGLRENRYGLKMWLVIVVIMPEERSIPWFRQTVEFGQAGKSGFESSSPVLQQLDMGECVSQCDKKAEDGTVSRQ
jgi:hypothetical protein